MNISDFLIEECVENNSILENVPYVDPIISQIHQQKKVANFVIDSVKNISNLVFIGGGALRDWEHNKVANDLDVFIFIPPTKCIDPPDIYENFLNTKVVSKIANKDCNYSDLFVRGINTEKDARAGKIIRYIYECEIEDFDIDLVIISNEHLKYSTKEQCLDILTESFDIGLCMIFSDGCKKYATKYFVDDFVNKKITFFNNSKTYSKHLYSVKHLIKVARKYPEYEIDININKKMQIYLNNMYSNYLNLKEEETPDNGIVETNFEFDENEL